MISIFKRIPLFQKIIQKRLQKESQYYLKNRKFVLQSYRYLLKTLPTLYGRKLQQKQKLNVFLSFIHRQQLRYIFQSQKVLQTLEQTKFKSQRLKESILMSYQQVVQGIKDKDYSFLGEYEIGLYCENQQMRYQLQDYREKYGIDKKKY